MKHIKALIDLLNASHVTLEGVGLEGLDTIKRATEEFERLQSQPDASDLLKRAAVRLENFAEVISQASPAMLKVQGRVSEALAKEIYEHLETKRQEFYDSLKQNIDQTMQTIADGEAKPDDYRRLAQLTREKQTLC